MILKINKVGSLMTQMVHESDRYGRDRWEPGPALAALHCFHWLGFLSWRVGNTEAKGCANRRPHKEKPERWFVGKAELLSKLWAGSGLISLCVFISFRLRRLYCAIVLWCWLNVAPRLCRAAVRHWYCNEDYLTSFLSDTRLVWSFIRFVSEPPKLVGKRWLASTAAGGNNTDISW